MLTSDIQTNGYCWFRNTLSNEHIARLTRLISTEPSGPGTRHTQLEEIADLLNPDGAIGKIAEAVLTGAKPVRFTHFQKSNQTNWLVPWHQDRIISVKEKVQLSGFTSWTKQDGHWNCEPPESILNDMIFLRIFLDTCSAENGAMEFAEGSHKLGKIASDQASRLAEQCPILSENANQGDILVCHGLLLHRSGKSRGPSSRRVLRIDYSNAVLPSQVDWAVSV